MNQEENRLAEAASRLEKAISCRKELEERLACARIRIRKAEAYHKIMNLMSAHVHCCMAQEYEKELDLFWSRREDIAYANGDMAYTGQEAVRRYYVEDSGKRAARTRKLLNLPEEGPQSGMKTPQYVNMNLIGTPYIEIAEDGQTAQGIWMAHSFMSCPEERGNHCSQGVLSRYSGEFIFEDGEWKIWHRRNYADVVFKEDPILGSTSSEFSGEQQEFPLPGPYSTWEQEKTV